MTTIKYKRRTFKEVASAAHAKGYAEGREQGRSVMALEGKLDNISLRKLAWLRITGLFKGGRHEL